MEERSTVQMVVKVGSPRDGGGVDGGAGACMQRELKVGWSVLRLSWGGGGPGVKSIEEQIEVVGPVCLQAQGSSSHFHPVQR